MLPGPPWQLQGCKKKCGGARKTLHPTLTSTKQIASRESQVAKNQLKTKLFPMILKGFHLLSNQFLRPKLEIFYVKLVGHTVPISPP